MKIVDVCAFYSPRGGGVKTYVEQKLAIGPRLGHEIVILAPGDRHAVFERGPNARIITIPAPRFPLDRNYWYFADEPALHAALDAEQPDIVEASSPWRSPAMVARWNGHVPKMLIMHADPLSAYAYRWLEPFFARPTIDRQFGRFWDHLRDLGQSFSQIICASHQLRDRLAAGGVANTIAIPMGVEAGLFAPERRNPALRRELLSLCGLPETASLLLGAGRLAPEKRWPMVVDAVAIASQRQPIGMVLLGEGSQRARIERKIAGNPHIRLLQPETGRERFAAILASVDALVHGCEAETFCMAAAEARASGILVIVPDQGGAADHAIDAASTCYTSKSALSAADAISRCLGEGRRTQASTAKFQTMDDHFAQIFANYALIRNGIRRAA
jgi:alpha-1,6-mannosyltransferase